MMKIIPKGQKGMASDHVAFSELDCKCNHKSCRSTVYSTKLLRLFEMMRDRLGDIPIKINSAYRCPLHNYEVGGKPCSQHTLGLALDIVPHYGVNLYEMKEMAKMLGFSFVLEYPEKNFVHVDIRELD